MIVDAAGLDWDAAYKLLVGAVVPRPIAWVTTLNAAGKVNAAPFSCWSARCCISISATTCIGMARSIRSRSRPSAGWAGRATRASGRS